MKIAFFAPLKAPDHPVPSGDRTMARALTAALRHGGHDVCHTSDLRIYDKMGDKALQDQLFAEAEAEVTRLLASPEAADWPVWITYHNYYKAPDLIGPAVSKALNIPYILIEATRARKRLRGPWERFEQAAEAACDAAHTIFYFTEQDAEALFRDAHDAQTLQHLPPFLAQTDLPPASDLNGPILAAGMFRPGDKLASYAMISETLASLDGDWSLRIAGDGPARQDVEGLFKRFGSRVEFLGALSPDAMPQTYANASCFIWPGVNEAFGMVYLEAQAAGLPIIAQDRPGVRDVVHGPRAPLAGGTKAMAERLSQVLESPDLRQSESLANRQKMLSTHMLEAAAKRLDDTLKSL